MDTKIIKEIKSLKEDVQKMGQSLQNNQNESSATFGDIINKNTIKVQPKKHTIPKNYLPRLVQSISDTKREKRTLENYIINSSKPLKIVIRGEAGMGKSVELESIAALISKHQYYPFLLKLKNWNKRPIIDYFPDLSRLKTISEKIILIIDGLDEEDIESVKKDIFHLITSFDKINIIISCRTNIYDNTIDDFEVLDLLPLSENQIDDYTKINIPLNIEQFRDEIQRNNLMELLFNPFYLVELIHIFKSNNNLPATKAEIFEILISKKINLRLKETSTLESEISNYKILCIEAVEKIAFVMQCSNKKSLSDDEVKKIIIKNEIRNLIKQQAGLIKYSNNKWQFEHNNFQEYLAAKVLSIKSFEAIQSIISFPKNFEITKPTWKNTIAMLFSILDKKSSLYDQVVEWLFEIEPSIFVNFEKERLPKKLREEIFQKIFHRIAKTGRVLAVYKIDKTKFANFATSNKTFKFLITQLQSDLDNNVYFTLNTLDYYPTSIISPSLKNELKSSVNRILKDDKKNSNLNYRLIVIACRFDLFNQDEIKKLIEIFWTGKDNHSKIELDFYIAEKKYQDYFYKELIGAYISKNDRKLDENEGGAKYFLQKAISNISSEEAIIYFLENCLLIEDDYKNNNRDLTQAIFNTIESKYLSNDKVFQVILEKIPEMLKSLEYYSFEHIYTLIALKRNQYQVFNYLISNHKEVVFKYYNLFFLANIANKDCINSLKSEFVSGNIDVSLINHYYTLLNNLGKEELAIYFKKLISEKHIFPIISKQKPQYDYKKMIEEISNLLLNKNSYIEIITNLFDIYNPISHEDLTLLRKEFDALDYQEQYVIHRMNEEVGRTKSIERTTVISCFDKNWEKVQIDEIYDLINNFKNLVLPIEIRQLIKKWVDKELPSIDFKNACYRKDNEEYFNIKANIVSTFIRKFQFRHYSVDIYLDLLSTSYLYMRGDLLKFLRELKIDEGLIRARILENLKNGIEVSSALHEHINYCDVHNVFEAKDYILNHIYDNFFNSDTKIRILHAYKTLKGDVEILEGLLEELEGDILEELISILIEMSSNEVVPFVAEKFNAEGEERKLKYAKFSVQFENIDALRYIINHLIEEKDSEININLTSYKSVNSIDSLLELYLIHYHPNIRNRDFGKINDKAWQGITSIALYHNQYDDVKNKVKSFINTLKDDESKVKDLDKLINDLEVHLDILEHEYYLKKSNEINIEQALISFIQI